MQREQRPGDRLQTGRVRADERVAAAKRLHDREQSFEDGVVQRDRSEAEHRDRVQGHNQSVCVRRRSNLESAQDPFLVGHGDQQREECGAEHPVHDDEDPQHEERDRQRGRFQAGLDMIHLFIDYR